MSVREQDRKQLAWLYDWIFFWALVAFSGGLALFADWAIGTTLATAPIYWFVIGVLCGEFLGEQKAKR